MLLSSKQFRALHGALMDAFPDLEALASLGRRQLDLRLSDVCAPADLPNVIHAVIQWAERHARVVDLVVGTLRERPAHVGLLEIVKSLHAREASQAPAYSLTRVEDGATTALDAGQFYTMGRDPGVEVVVPRTDRKASVRHALLEVAEWGVVIRDLGSKNRVFVNKHAVSTHLCRPGDSIRVGRTIFVLSAHGEVVDVPQDPLLPLTETETDDDAS